jgi:hypothetical protein
LTFRSPAQAAAGGVWGAGSSVWLDRGRTGCRHAAQSRHGSWPAVHQHCSCCSL